MNMIYKKKMYIRLAAALLAAGSLGGRGKKVDPPVDTRATAVRETSPVEPETRLVRGIGQLIPDGPDHKVVKDTITPETEPVPEYLREDVEHAKVAGLQARLMELGFMNSSEPTRYFGHMTQAAVLPFQRQNELDMDGIMEPETWDAIMASDARYYVVPNGVSEEDIKRIQNRLYGLRYLTTPNLATGRFDGMAEAAIIRLQGVNGTAVDGKVGRQTVSLLYSDETKPSVLAYDDKSEVVLAVQKRLEDLDYLTTDPGGGYGFDTMATVEQLQSCNGLMVDSYLGPSIRFTLNDSSAVPNGMPPGDRGDSVQRVQQLLSRYGYFSSSNVTGYYGRVAEGAVKNFQSTNGLSSDGSVGRLTTVKLTGDSVKKATSESETSSSGDNGRKSFSGSSNGSSGGGGGGVSPPISVASSKLGSPYVYRARDSNSFDCSSLVYQCLNQVGVKQSYLILSDWCSVGEYTKISDFGDLRAGDIIVVNDRVGIVTDKGAVIGASSSNGEVVHGSLSSWWRSDFICGWRMFRQGILK